jgi:uncharacterized membrane protein YfcA
MLGGKGKMMIISDPVVLWAIVGAASGVVFGIAGSGGGVITIPILMILGGYGIKDASGYALISLMVGAFISWFIQRKNTLYPLTAVLIVFAAIVAFISAPLKMMSPSWFIIVLLNITFVFSLYSLWVLRKPNDPGEDRPLSYQVKTATVGGMITGFLSTMTGLGGGVVIIPWLTGITRISYEQAMACSLLTVAATAPFSAWRQERFDLALPEWISLAIGILIMALVVKKSASYIQPDRMIVIRKVAMTGIILISMVRTIMELFY